MRCEEMRPRKSWVRLASRLAVAAACTIMLLRATGAAAMTADDCQKLSADALMLAVDEGLCTLDVAPSAGPPQVADRGTSGEHSGENTGGGSGGGDDGGGSGGDGSGGSGGGSGGGGGGDEGGGDDGGSGGDDGGHDHDHGHGHGHGHHGGHGGCHE